MSATLAPILLDPIGDADPPDGYRLIDSERDLLEHAPAGRLLFIRGRELCRWATDYYESRDIPTRETDSPRRAIRAAVTQLTDDQADELAALITPDRLAALPRPLTPRHIIDALHPDRLWHDEPSADGSADHVAAWLLWVHANRPGPTLRAVLQPLVADWGERVDRPLRPLYAATDADAADGWLRAWLAIRPDPAAAALGEFPLPVPADLVSEARRQWAADIIRTDGGRYDQLQREQLPTALTKAAAAEMIQYLLANPDRLTQARYDALAPYCSPAERTALSGHLQPAPPAAPPATTPEAMLDWFERSYLPYRVWQSRHTAAEESTVADERARRFAEWYFERYPSGLLGGELQPHLSFRQTLGQARESAQTDAAAVLVVVLDGLHAEDARRLLGRLVADAGRLSLLERRWVFAPLPTVTRFAKDALLKGLEPRAAAAHGPLSSAILPERLDPSPYLANAAPGDWYIWRVMEPDETYHGYNNHDLLAINVDMALQKVAATVAAVVGRVPDDVALRIILTSDHGRLLADAVREIDVPAGMESHGRAAWGPLRHRFDETGVVIDGDLAFLHGERFGLPAEVGEVAVPIGPQMFKTNDKKRGREAFPHGGAYPEEVIVPWFVLERDWQPPAVGLTLSGSAQAGRRAAAALEAINPADYSPRLAELVLTAKSGTAWTLPVDAALRPRAKDSLSLAFDSWPTAAEIDGMVGRAIFRMPTGREFEAPVTIKLESREMYRRDTLLEDLD